MSKAARAAVVREPGGTFTIEDVELDDLRVGEVYVRIEAVGVCHTDMNMQQFVPMPAIVGHEGAGVVEEVGAGVEYVKPGDRVMISWPTCGECPNCAIGRRDICDLQFPLLFGGRRKDGSSTVKLNGEWISGAFFQQSSFSTYALAPADSLIKVDDDVPVEILAALPCGVMTGAGAVTNTLGVTAQDDLMVLGTGAVGLSAVMAANLVGAWPIIAVDVNDYRLALARELGATHAFNPLKDDVAERVRELVPRGLRFAFDSSGVPASWKTAVRSLCMGGTFGGAAPPMGDDLDFNVGEAFGKGLRLQFVMGGSAVPRVYLPNLIKWYKRGHFPVDRLVTTFPFADINTAWAESHAGRAVKPVLLMTQKGLSAPQ
jgi:aryl-alcohol dehydrogenase